MIAIQPRLVCLNVETVQRKANEILSGDATRQLPSDELSLLSLKIPQNVRDGANPSAVLGFC